MIIVSVRLMQIERAWAGKPIKRICLSSFIAYLCQLTFCKKIKLNTHLSSALKYMREM